MSGTSSDPADIDLDRLLGSLTPPPVPAGLAARIVRDVTRLPQVAPEEEIVSAPVSVEQSATIIPIGAASSHRRRWMAWAGGGLGTALAAGLATLMLVPEAAERNATPATAPTPMATAPSASVAEAQAVPPITTPAPIKEETASPRLAATTTLAAPAPSNHVASPALPIALPTLETAQNAPAPTSDTPSQVADTVDDTALPDTELAGSGNMATPSRNGGKAPTAQGWGFGAGSTYVPDAPASQGDDEMGGRQDRRGGPGRRF